MSVKSIHNAGFFSCCSVKLTNIVDFINLNKKIPSYVDSSEQFIWYKPNNNKEDITYDYFEHYANIEDNIDTQNVIDYHWDHQFLNYSTLDYTRIYPLIEKYFSPSNNINEIVNNIERKYNLIYENICVLFYRGNDKIRETKLCEYDDYLKYANEIINKNANITFLIQSDETEFIDFIRDNLPDNSFYFKDEIRHMNKCNDTVDITMSSTNNDFSKKYLAITIIMSKCKYIICGSGNCSIWIMFYRRNSNNVIQYLNGTFYNSM
jgi:hypothetical protein